MIALLMLSDTVWLAVIGGLVGLMQLFGSAFLLLLKARLDKNTVLTERTSKDVAIISNDMKDLEKNTNNKMDQLLEAERAKGQIEKEAEHAKGKLEGSADELARQALRNEGVASAALKDGEKGKL